jgi:hypothetical protein
MGNISEELNYPICTHCNENESIDGFLCWTCLYTLNELDLELTLEWTE